MSIEKLHELDQRLIWLIDRAVQQTEQKEELNQTDSRLMVDLSKVMTDLHKRLSGVKVIGSEAESATDKLESLFDE